jgi:hypothetical protein
MKVYKGNVRLEKVPNDNDSVGISSLPLLDESSREITRNGKLKSWGLSSTARRLEL